MHGHGLLFYYSSERSTPTVTPYLRRTERFFLNYFIVPFLFAVTVVSLVYAALPFGLGWSSVNHFFLIIERCARPSLYCTTSHGLNHKKVPS